MTRSPHRRGLVWIVLLGAMSLWAPPTHGRVFSRWGRAGSRTLHDAVAGAGGRLAYEAPMWLNGGHGRLSAYGFVSPLSDVGGMLAARFDAPALRPARGQSMVMTRLLTGGRETTVLALRARDPERCLVLLFENEPGGAGSDPTPPRGTPWPALARARFAARDDKTGVTFVTGDTPLAAADVRAALRGDLEREGWIPALSGATAQDLYVREARLCLVLADPDAGGGATRLSVLLY